MGKTAAKPRIFSSESYALHDGDYDFYGDAYTLSKTDIGGNDSFSADGNASYRAYGDAYQMIDSSRGGNDNFNSGGGSGDIGFAGDAATMSGISRGGDDYINGTNNNNATETLVGDAWYSMTGGARGGNDRLWGGHGVDGYAVNNLFGDTQSNYGAGNAVIGGNDSLFGGNAFQGDGYAAAVDNNVYGDSGQLRGHSTGGADTLVGGNSNASGDGYATADNTLIGDGGVMTDYALGGADLLFGGNSDGYAAATFNSMSGDASDMWGQSVGGNDFVIGGYATNGGFVLNEMAGDTFSINGAIKFGGDYVQGGNGDGSGHAVNLMAGDSLEYLEFQGTSSLPDWIQVQIPEPPNPGHHNGPLVFANDTLNGGWEYASNEMYGDTGRLFKGDLGGNDTLIAGGSTTTNLLVGDAQTIDSGATGGKDSLYGGAGNDVMWGDAVEMYGKGGADVFGFSGDVGNDTIEDFRKNDGDKIDLSWFHNSGWYGFSSFTALMNSGRVEWTGSDTVLHLDYFDPDSSNNTVTLAGVYIGDLNTADVIL